MEDLNEKLHIFVKTKSQPPYRPKSLFQDDLTDIQLLTEDEIIEEIKKDKKAINCVPNPTKVMLQMHRLLWKI